ncbi:hypothetical protein CUQ99_19110 [Acinetobacter baumannii]|nr:hypothetical protein [Acinetobacter baumannii]MBF7720751.1 hypothetical protein [Acinetobacter baumannii]
MVYVALQVLLCRSFRTFITFFVAFLTNFWFQDLFKERIREACLINFLTYRLNFEIFKSK